MDVISNGTTILSNNHADFAWTYPAILKALVFGSIITGTIIGNSLVLISFFSRKIPINATHSFIANLALADFLIGVLVLPLLATYHVTDLWYFGREGCMAWTCIHFWLCSASILSIMGICLDRYLGIRSPLKHYRLMGLRRIGLMTGALWLIAGCLAIIPLFVWPEPPSEDKFVCVLNEQLGHVLVVSVGIMYIPTAVMISLYWMIYRTATRHLQSLRLGYKETETDCGTTFNGNAPMYIRVHIGRTSQESLIDHHFKRQANLTKKLGIVVGAFIFSYVPFFTLFLIRSIIKGSISIQVFSIFGWIRYFNSCLNPIIYALMLPTFRKAFGEILHCKSASV